MTTATRMYHLLVRADRSDQEPTEQERTGRNGLLQVLANALQATGDQVVNAKTVLPWALTAVGAPAAFLALLVPVRESGSMLPQAAMAPVLERSAGRRHYWLWGAAGQATATAGMALAVGLLSGWLAGVVVVALLALFALARSLNSLAGKDVLGRTVPKGERGQINGLSTTLSGAVAITLGVAIRALGGEEVSVAVLAWLLGAAAIAWVLALAVFAAVREPRVEPGAAGAAGEQSGWVSSSWRLLREDAALRRFVIARGLLLVSALSPPFVVALAVGQGGPGLSGLGPFVIAQGLAGLIGGRAFGRWSDRSSQRLMTWAAAAASGTVIAFLALHLVPATRTSWLYPVTFLLLALAHTAVRVARKTYVVDMAGEARRTSYVAVSNTAISIVLLVVGALSSALALLGEVAALGFLAVLGLVGVLVARTLPDVSKGRGG